MPPEPTRSRNTRPSTAKYRTIFFGPSLCVPRPAMAQPTRSPTEKTRPTMCCCCQSRFGGCNFQPSPPRRHGGGAFPRSLRSHESKVSFARRGDPSLESLGLAGYRGRGSLAGKKKSTTCTWRLSLACTVQEVQVDAFLPPGATSGWGWRYLVCRRFTHVGALYRIPGRRCTWFGPMHRSVGARVVSPLARPPFQGIAPSRGVTSGEENGGRQKNEGESATRTVGPLQHCCYCQ